MLMAHIEPELTSEQSKTLAEKYKNESPEERALRKQRYDLAFERCQRAYNEYMATLDAQVARYRRDAFLHAEMEDRSHEEGAIGRLGSFILQSA